MIRPYGGAPAPMQPPQTAGAFVGPPQSAGAGAGVGVDMNSLTPAMIQQMVALGTIDEEQANILRQRLRSEKQLDSGLKGGYNVRGGFVADNPLAMVGKLLRDYKANKDITGEGGFDEREAELRNEQKRSRGDFVSAITGLFGGGGGGEESPVSQDPRGRGPAMRAGEAAAQAAALRQPQASVPAPSATNGPLLSRMNPAPRPPGAVSPMQGPTRGGGEQVVDPRTASTLQAKGREEKTAKVDKMLAELLRSGATEKDAEFMLKRRME